MCKIFATAAGYKWNQALPVELVAINLCKAQIMIGRGNGQTGPLAPLAALQLGLPNGAGQSRANFIPSQKQQL